MESLFETQSSFNQLLIERMEMSQQINASQQRPIRIVSRAIKLHVCTCTLRQGSDKGRDEWIARLIQKMVKECMLSYLIHQALTVPERGKTIGWDDFQQLLHWWRRKDCWPRERERRGANDLGWARYEGVGTAASKWSHPRLLLSDGPLRCSFTWSLIGGKGWKSSRRLNFFDSISILC